MTPTLGVEDAICIWDYNHIPQWLKEFMDREKISACDADWFALKPLIYKDIYISWMECPPFGCCMVEEYPVGTVGYTLVVGYHA